LALPPRPSPVCNASRRAKGPPSAWKFGPSPKKWAEFVANIRPPHGIGTLELEDGSTVPSYQYDPLRNLSPEYPPTLLIYGNLDTDIPVAQAHMLAGELSLLGVEHSLITHPEWEHLFDLNRTDDPEVEAAMDEILKFVQRHLH
jgi:acetyl esterase/lipase